MSNDEIIKEEIDSILSDIRELYNKSGKKASGEFSRSLEAVYKPNEATVRGVVYMAGRRAGKMPPVQAILRWLKDKGIKAIGKNISLNSLAFAIAKKISEKGTAPENHLKIYEAIITPQRIQKIIDRVSVLNVNRIITEIQAELTLLAKNV